MRLLVVDADLSQRSALAALLQQLNYVSVSHIDDIDIAGELIHQRAVDMVLVDWQILQAQPDAISRCKNLAGQLHLPVLVILNKQQRQRHAECLQLGADDVLLRPYRPVIIEAILRAHSRARILSEQLEQQNQELKLHQVSIQREHAIVEHIFANALEINADAQQLMDFHLAPASNFNGDLFLLNTSYMGTLYFLIGDFTGHGLASAIGALPTAKAFMTTSAKGLPVEEIAATLNSTLRQLLPGDMFFACIVGEIDNAGVRMRIWNGGMPPLLLFSAEGELRKEFNSQHMSLGIMEPNEFERDVMQYIAEPGDRLLGFTDGVTEVTNQAGRMLGVQGIKRWLSDTPDIDIHQLITRLEIFRGPGKQLDDITLFSFRCGQLPAEKARIVPLMPWHFTVTIEGEDIRLINPITRLIEQLSAQRGLHRHSGYLFTILSELYANALEHGLLQLDSSMKDDDEGFSAYYRLREQRLAALKSGKIRIEMSFNPRQQQIVICVEDSGQGFGYKEMQTGPQGLDALHGRGLNLLRCLSGNVEYADGGTRVTVVYHLDN